MNLCNSGKADCYASGLVIPEAGDLIRETEPEQVTVNEICESDVDHLQSSLAEVWPNDYTYSAFAPAMNLEKNEAILCTNGQPYGSAVLGRLSVDQVVYGAMVTYEAQDGTAESRTAVCAYPYFDDILACSTHLSAKSETVALDQCNELMHTAIPELLNIYIPDAISKEPSGRTIVGGDLNLEYDKSDSQNVQLCVPDGYTRKGDGDVMHVIFSNDFEFVDTATYGITYSDHPALWIVLNIP
jgi:hypothetical protein